MTEPRTAEEIQAELDAAMVRLKLIQDRLGTNMSAMMDGRLVVDHPDVKATNKESDAITREVKRLIKEAKAARKTRA